jgi:cell division septum initiation protein DivIVA
VNPTEPPRRAGRSLALTHLTGDTMTEQSDLIPDLDSEDAFEVQMRGYSRRQVNEFVARSRSQTRDLEERLSRSIDEVERLRTEVSASRQREMEEKPAHQELSERMAQILKLADDEAKAEKSRALEEITQQRNDAKQEIDRLKAEAREQTERMLAAAQEQAENTIATARSEAEKARTSARNEAERTIGDAQKKSENAVAAAQAQAKQMLDEATARATAIHDGAERRLNLLVARHTETVRRLTEVRDVVTNLVAGEAARGSLEEEVARSVASAVSGNGGGGNGAARTGGAPEARHTPAAAPAAGSRPADGPANGAADTAAARSHRGGPVPGERVPAERPAPSGAPGSGSPTPGSTSGAPGRPAAKPIRPTAGRGTPGSLGEQAAPPADGARMTE